MNSGSSDLGSALRCYATYYKPDYFERMFDAGEVWAGYKEVSSVPTITCRGSWSWEDWLRNLESIRAMVVPDLGLVGDGFYEGVDDGCAALFTLNLPKNQTIRFEGHSQGGTHALYLAGKFALAGYAVEVVALDPPRSCGPKLCAILDGHPVRVYRNLLDEVTDLPPACEGLVHPRTLLPLQCEPVSLSVPAGKYHHIQLICCALALQDGGFCAELPS